MDNLTHGLLGVALARALHPQERGRAAALLTGVLASNLPDIDFLYLPLFSDRKLAYLVHHRGYTHTLGVALLMGAALTEALYALSRRRHPDDTPSRLRLHAIAALGVLLHMGADAWNNYGVHPLWPLVRRWWYGDFIFIVEPWLFAPLLPLAFAQATRPWVRRVGAGIAALLAAVQAAWIGPGLAAVWSLAALAAWRAQPRLPALALPVAGVAAVLATFFSAGLAAEARVRGQLAAAWPEEEIVEVMRVPRPGVPWCWSFQAASLAPDGTYTLRSGALSLLPAASSPTDCAFRSGGGTLPLAPVSFDAPGHPAPDVAGIGAWSAPVADLRALASDRCRAGAFLHFARLPWWWAAPSGEVWLGDLRYDFEPGPGFAEVPLDAPGGCEAPPSWRSRPVERLLGL